MVLDSKGAPFRLPLTRICFKPPRAFATVGGMSITASPDAFSGRKYRTLRRNLLIANSLAERERFVSFQRFTLQPHTLTARASTRVRFVEPLLTAVYQANVQVQVVGNHRGLSRLADALRSNRQQVLELTKPAHIEPWDGWLSGIEVQPAAVMVRVSRADRLLKIEGNPAI